MNYTPIIIPSPSSGPTPEEIRIQEIRDRLELKEARPEDVVFLLRELDDASARAEDREAGDRFLGGIVALAIAATLGFLLSIFGDMNGWHWAQCLWRSY